MRFTEALRHPIERLRAGDDEEETPREGWSEEWIADTQAVVDAGDRSLPTSDD